MKTLIIEYIPKNKQSNTEKLLDAIREEIKYFDIEELDLLFDEPDLFLSDRLLAYINRDFLVQKLLPEEEYLLSKLARMAIQLKSADIVVTVFLMYNFSVSAIVEAWFDSVMQEVTFGKENNGQIISNAEKKKRLICDH
jgi:FMN-dependent NADH-azoreductase